MNFQPDYKKPLEKSGGLILNINNMRIIVTGGAGFIGSAFINHLKENYQCDVVCVDNLSYCGNKDNIKHEVEFIEKDICDITTEDLGEYDFIVHFAAESHVDNSIKNGLPFVKTNVQGTFNLLECSRMNPKLKKFIHISTDEVYGDMEEDNHPFVHNKSANESNPLNPSSYYSSTKTSSDLLVMSANRTYGLPYLITRTCNNFGEHQYEEKFLPKIYKCINNGDIIPIYGDGKQVREWIYVYDNVKIICDLMFDDKILNDVFNIGSGIRYTNVELIDLISKTINKEVEYNFVPDRLGHDKAYRLNCVKLNKYYMSKGVNLEFKPIKDYLEEIYS
jgi:dTDP-glucose 4,6-dehydratase